MPCSVAQNLGAENDAMYLSTVTISSQHTNDATDCGSQLDRKPAECHILPIDATHASTNKASQHSIQFQTQ